MGMLAIGLLVIGSGCGSDDTAATGAASISDMPAATGAVSTTASVRSAFGNRRGAGQLFTASTGVKLSAWANASWGSTKSGAMCQTGAEIKEMWRSASDPDVIACYLGLMEAASLFTTPFDGTDKVYTLNSGEGGTFKIKFVATKDGNGFVNSFKMFECDSDDAQKGYSSKTVSSAGAVAITALYAYSQSTFTGANRTTVTGVYDAGADIYTSKTIVATSSNSQTGAGAFTQKQSMTLTQTNGRFDLTGFGTGTFSGNNYTNTMVTAVQSINEGNVSLIALGDGASKFDFDFGGGSTYSGTISWNGDTQENISGTNDQTAVVTSATLPTAASITTPTFTAADGEVWDCSDTPISTINLSTAIDETLFNTCDTQYGFADRDWVDCQSGDFD